MIKLIKKIFKKSKNKNDVLKKAVQLIEKKKMDDTINKVIDSYVFSIKNHPQFAHSDLFKARTEVIEIEFKYLLDRTIGWEHVEGEMFKIYNQLYTDDELQEMIKFYSTDLGKKLLETQDNINTMKMYFVNDKLKNNQEELSNILNKVESMPFNN